MAASSTDALFVTANVGSIFEDPTLMLKIWCDEFLSTVTRLSPKFVALHCQEVGGKNYERSMQHVADFVKLLMSSEELKLFNKVRIFLDEDYSSAEHFTALGNFYFIHESISEENIEIFNFQDRKFEPALGKEVYSENIEEVATKEKSKFPQEFFPECKWSRKGFMRTRWNLNGTIFDLINIHLFHDASNFVAMESFPSVYCKNRQRALDHTLKRFHTDQYGIVPFFVFGDFNFRTDTQGVVKKLSEGLNAVKVPSIKSSDHAKVQYRDESSQEVVFTLGKKEFSHQDHQKLFFGEDSEWLREFDRELESFNGQLYEFGINFPPTYPYVEDSESGELYMQTRCPSWCDRVFFSSSARLLVDCTDGDIIPDYGLIGQNACMGDHKPVFLRVTLLGGIGTVSCCALPAPPCTSCLSAASPLEHICRLCSEQSVEFSSFPLYAEPEQDHSGLVVPKFHRHTSPYTPDSTDTEADLGEEFSPTEESVYLKTRNDRRVNRFDIISRKRPYVSNESAKHAEDVSSIHRGLSSRKSVSKIPVRVQEVKESVMHTSKIPVLKHIIPTHENDFKLKCKNGKNVSPPSTSPMDCHGKRFSYERDGGTSSCDSLASPKLVGIISGDVSSVPKPQSLDGRKQLSRQMNIDEQSSDSDAVSLELRDDQFLMPGQSANEIASDEPKVEIQLSLVETSPSLISPLDCESVGLLTTKSLGLGGSTTDSGVSVSPDLSVATSPSTDETDKVTVEPGAGDSPEIDDHKNEADPLSLERFSFVRRIQSASAMERKSSFPLPSSIFMENQSALTGFGGSGSNLWGMRTCRCMSDSSWRQRSSTMSHSLVSSKIGSRIRLISTSSHLDKSLPRLQSHHSSSEEDWFEEITSEPAENSKSDHKQTMNHGDIKLMQNMVDCGERLQTHQEYVPEKNFDVNMRCEHEREKFEGIPRLNLGINELVENRPFQPDSIRAVAVVGKTFAQTCFIDTERASRGKESESLGRDHVSDLVVHDARETQSTKEPECSMGSGEAILQACCTVPSHPDDSALKSKEAPIRPRRSSITSGNSKTRNSSSCKACCVLM